MPIDAKKTIQQGCFDLSQIQKESEGTVDVQMTSKFHQIFE